MVSIYEIYNIEILCSFSYALRPSTIKPVAVNKKALIFDWP